MDEFILKMGFNADAEKRGTEDMLSRQRKAARDYTGFWKTALEEREAAEVKHAVRQAERDNLARRLWRERSAERTATIAAEAKLQERLATEAAAETAATTLAIEKEKNRVSIQMARGAAAEKAALGEGALAAASAQVIMQRGSGMFGSIESAAEGAAAGGGLKAANKAGHSMATAMREVQVLIHEGLRGNFKRMIGSASILASALGVLGTIIAGLIVTLPLTLLVGYKGYQLSKALGYEKQSGKDLTKKDHEVAEEVRKRIGELKTAGKLSDHDATEYLRQLENPSNENVNSVLGSINKLQKDGSASELEKAAQKKRSEHRKVLDHVAEEQKELDNLNAKERTKKEIIADEGDKIGRIAYWKEQIRGLDRSSLEYAQGYSNMLDAQVALEKDKLDAKKMQAEEDRKAKEKAAEMTSMAREAANNIARINQANSVYPTIGELAKKRRSPFSWIARDIQQQQREQIRLREFGSDYDYFDQNSLSWQHHSNATAIQQTVDRIGRDRNVLEGSGVIAPELKLEATIRNTNAILAKMALAGGTPDAIQKAITAALNDDR